MKKHHVTCGVFILAAFLITTAMAFEISGTYTEEGQKWLNDHWGENITIGQVEQIAYTQENLDLIKANVDPKLLEHIWSQPYYWGSRTPWGTDDYPECPHGANVWDETDRPVNIRNLNVSQKLDMGLENAVTDKSGCRIVGYMDQSVTQGEMKSFHRVMPKDLDRFTYDLYWQDQNSSMKLTIFAPDGKMGPYYDESDGRKNGRIYVQISRLNGISAGDWYAVVEGEHVKGTQQFMLLAV
ncbi:hypothetical protein [Methanoregula sp.]|jgi:hypothetical protein|uniref:hypothetical protein n=1 Tax=Methanoregula sp. TaxID=2052170 RepID=UPI003567DED4